MPSRPESRAEKAILSPSPSSPISRSAGIRTSSKFIADVVEPVRPIFCSGGLARQAGCVGRDQEAGDPVAALAGAGHHLVEVGVAAVRGPRLGAVDHPLVAVAPGGGAHRGRVGAGVRLGEAVGAEQLAAEHVGQPALPLLLGAAGGQAVAGQRVHRDADADAGPDGADLLEHLEVDLVGLRRRRRTPRGRAGPAARPGRACGRCRAGRSRRPRRRPTARPARRRRSGAPA